MNTEEFDYYLPEELIAQTPLKDRSASRLMVLDRKTGQIEHRIFKDIVNYLDENDVLVLNDTRSCPRTFSEAAQSGAGPPGSGPPGRRCPGRCRWGIPGGRDPAAE